MDSKRRCAQGEVWEGRQHCHPCGGHNLEALQALHFGDLSGGSLTHP